MDKEKSEKLKKEARRYNIKEGIFNSAKDSVGVEYVSPFAIAINSSNSLVALLSSIPGILGPLSQIIGSKKIGKVSRKKIVSKSILLEAFVWLFLAIICFLFLKNIFVQYLPFMVLILFSIHAIIVNFLYPSWFSWTGDLINEKYRGRWFSKRTMLLGIVSISLVICSAFVLDLLKAQGKNMQGFILLFLLAFVFRLFSYHSIKKVYEPKINIKKTDYFSFWQFIKKSTQNNFGKFTIYRGLIGFSSAISSSLLAIYLLRNLKFTYVEYMIILYAGTFFSLFILELWGRIADRYGNYFVLCLTSILIPTIPILWIIKPSFLYLLLVPSLIEGISWAGFNLSTGNFIYDSVRPEKRGIAVSYYNMVRGIGIFLGAGIGAILIGYWKVSIIEPIIAIFFVGAIFRMIVVFFFLTKINEIRKIRKTKNNNFGKVILKQVKPALLGGVHDIISIRSYLRK